MSDFIINNNVLEKYTGKNETAVIPDSVKIVGEEAFKGCRCLTNVIFPKNLTHIEDNAFWGCGNLTSITIPDGVTSIGSGAFAYCEGLKSIKIPDSVKSIGQGAFFVCTNLEWIESPVMINYKMMPGHSCIVLLNNDRNDTYYYAYVCKNKYITESTSDNLTDFAKRGKWAVYDMELINNGPKYKYTLSARLIGALGRLLKPKELTEENKRLFYDLLTKNIKKVIPIAESLNRPEIVKALFELSLINIQNEKNIRKLIAAAQMPEIAELAMFETQAAPKPIVVKENIKKDTKIKLSELKKVQLLEEAVINNDIQEVQALFKEHKTFEFTARAMGLACLYANIEMVKTLIEEGASFTYVYDPVFKRKYGAAYGSKETTYPVNYSKLISWTNINIYNPVIYAYTQEFHFGALPNVEKEENPETDRADIAEYLLSVKKSGFDSEEALFYSILWGNKAVADRLLQKGVVISQNHIKDLSTSESSIDRNELLVTLPALLPGQCLYALKVYNSFLIGDEKKIVLNQKMFEPVGNKASSMLSADVLEYLLNNTDIEKISKNKVIERIIDNDDAGALSVITSTGAIRTVAQREKIIKYALEQDKKEALAFLLEYKNKKADIIAEKAKEENKLMKELSEDPNSVSALKKIWGYKKLDNGTLMISSYKGAEVEVEVPEKIGKAHVSVIGENAFSTSEHGNIKNQVNRRRITSVRIPNGIEEIGKNAFYGCEALETIEIPESVKIIGAHAFEECINLKDINLSNVQEIRASAFLKCRNLTNVNLSEDVQTREDIFAGCDLLKDSTGLIIINNVLYGYYPDKHVSNTLVIPESVEKIAPYAFLSHQMFAGSFEKAILPNSLIDIGEGAFMWNDRLKEITIPKGIRTINDYTFANTGLEIIILPEGLEQINTLAFKNTNIVDLHIPSSVTKIDNEAFSGCNNLLIHTPESSYAGEYAKKRNIPFDNNYCYGNSI